MKIALAILLISTVLTGLAAKRASQLAQRGAFVYLRYPVFSAPVDPIPKGLPLVYRGLGRYQSESPRGLMWRLRKFFPPQGLFVPEPAPRPNGHHLIYRSFGGRNGRGCCHTNPQGLIYCD